MEETKTQKEEESKEYSTKQARKRQGNIVIFVLIWFFIFPFSYMLSRGIVLSMLQLHTWYVAFTYLVIGLLFVIAIWKLAVLLRTERSIKAKQSETPKQSWKKRAVFCRIRTVGLIALIFLWCCVSLFRWSDTMLDAREVKLSDYGKEPPFATMEDFAADEENTYHRIIIFDKDYNRVKEYTDWIAPLNVEWEEYGQIAYEDGTLLEGNLEVDYHKTIGPVIAKRLVADYHRADMDKSNPIRDAIYGGFDHYELLETPELDVDEVIAYYDKYGFPTIVIRNGNLVVHASFYQFQSEARAIELEKWAQIIVESIAEQ